MNERIKQQAEWRFADKTTGNFSEYDQRLEKFAELIVRECVSVAMEQYDDTLPWGGVEDVLKHFGVEE